MSVWSEVQIICICSSYDATAAPSSVASLKFRMVYLSGAGLIIIIIIIIIPSLLVIDIPQ